MAQRHEEFLRINRREVNIILARLGWTQQELADAIGCPGTSLSQVLAGKRPYSLLPISIAAALGVELEHITEP